MKKVRSLEALNQLKTTEKGLLILFGGQQCSVCQSIQPKLMERMTQQYPKMTLVYVDCHTAPEVCAQNGVMSLPTLQVFFDGGCFIEEVRTFSLQNVLSKIQRPYQLLFTAT